MSVLRFGRTFWITLLGLMAAEGLSVWGWHQPDIGKIIFAIIGLGTLALACWRLEIGVWVVLAELVIGSKGYLLAWTVGSFNISIRLALFGAIMLAWLVQRIRQRNFPFMHSSVFRSYIWLAGYLVFGVGLGWLYHNQPSNIFYDVNGYLYLGLLPVFFDALRNRQDVRQMFQVLWAAIVAVSLKTLVLLFLFAGQFEFLKQVYRWVRDTRINEITIIAANAYRIFSQSQIYGLFGFFLALALLALLGQRLAQRRWWQLFFYISSFIVLASYSRSFWLALAVTMVVWFWYLSRRAGWSKAALVKHAGWLAMVLILELAVIVAVIRLPNVLHINNNTASLSSLVEERLSSDEQAGLQSRWNLLSPLLHEIIRQPVVGQGFGRTVTYQSQDPRLLQSASHGQYTTYSFEWGYLDMLLKMGIVGLVIYAGFIYRVIRSGVRALDQSDDIDRPVIVGLLFALIALLATHVTTPYLSHPLGIGFIIICVVVFERIKHAEPIPAK